MNRLNFLLLVALIASAIGLVNTAYEGRRLFAAVDSAKAEEANLNAEFKRLDAERQAQATNLRVDKVAREKLQMRPAMANVIQPVVDADPMGVAK